MTYPEIRALVEAHARGEAIDPNEAMAAVLLLRDTMDETACALRAELEGWDHEHWQCPTAPLVDCLHAAFGIGDGTRPMTVAERGVW